MNLKTSATVPNGEAATGRKLWGVAYHAERRYPRKKWEGQEAEASAWGEDIECVSRGHYEARLHLLGKQRAIGTAATPLGAARLVDSARWHLWGWQRNPTTRRFNLLRKSDPPPALLPKVADMRLKLRFEAKAKGIDPNIFDYNYDQRNNV